MPRISTFLSVQRATEKHRINTNTFYTILDTILHLFGKVREEIPNYSSLKIKDKNDPIYMFVRFSGLKVKGKEAPAIKSSILKEYKMNGLAGIKQLIEESTARKEDIGLFLSIEETKRPIFMSLPHELQERYQRLAEKNGISYENGVIQVLQQVINEYEPKRVF